MEAEATFTVQQVAATAIMLYLCMSSCLGNKRKEPIPFHLVQVRPLLTAISTAPFAVDMISRIF